MNITLKGLLHKIHYIAKCLWTPEDQTHMWVFPRLLLQFKVHNCVYNVNVCCKCPFSGLWWPNMFQHDNASVLKWRHGLTRLVEELIYRSLTSTPMNTIWMTWNADWYQTSTLQMLLWLNEQIPKIQNLMESFPRSVEAVIAVKLAPNPHLCCLPMLKELSYFSHLNW